LNLTLGKTLYYYWIWSTFNIKSRLACHIKISVQIYMGPNIEVVGPFHQHFVLNDKNFISINLCFILWWIYSVGACSIWICRAWGLVILNFAIWFVVCPSWERKIRKCTSVQIKSLSRIRRWNIHFDRTFSTCCWDIKFYFCFSKSIFTQ